MADDCGCVQEEYCCMPIKKEAKFIVDIIESFEKLLAFSAQNFGGQLFTPLKFENQACNADKIYLTEEGSIMYIYTRAFNEPYPCGTPNPVEAARIHAIREALGYNKKKCHD